MLIQKADCIEISTKNIDLCAINIYDSRGKLITTRNGNATDKVVFSAGLFSKGIYFVQVDDTVLKFIVK